MLTPSKPMLQEWRWKASHRSDSRLAATSHSSHVSPLADTQFHGHMRLQPGRISAAARCSYLAAALDARMLQRALQCAQGLSKVWDSRVTFTVLAAYNQCNKCCCLLL